jgi:hypothetical protein
MPAMNILLQQIRPIGSGFVCASRNSGLWPWDVGRGTLTETCPCHLATDTRWFITELSDNSRRHQTCKTERKKELEFPACHAQAWDWALWIQKGRGSQVLQEFHLSDGQCPEPIDRGSRSRLNPILPLGRYYKVIL